MAQKVVKKAYLLSRSDQMNLARSFRAGEAGQPAGRNLILSENASL
jgi:hypothetical protein